MTVKLNCSSSGSVALSAPANTNSGADIVLNLPSDAGSLDRLERAGNILQVVQGTTTTQVNSNAISFVDSGLSVSITPTSSNSKVLILVDQSWGLISPAGAGTIGANAIFGMRVQRGSTTIINPRNDSAGPYDYGFTLGGVSSIAVYGRQNFSFLDSPNTTSATTYKTQAKVYRTEFSVRMNQSENSSGGIPPTSRIILMEVAG
jgi:hypothetical protein